MTLVCKKAPEQFLINKSCMNHSKPGLQHSENWPDGNNLKTSRLDDVGSSAVAILFFFGGGWGGGVDDDMSSLIPSTNI